MAVNLTDLSLPQLEGLKTQLDQVLTKSLVYMGFIVWVRIDFMRDEWKQDGG